MSRLTGSSAIVSRSQSRLSLVIALAMTCVGAAACAPSQKQLDAHATVVAGNVFATQTAHAPTRTSIYAGQPTRTSLPTLTLAPTLTYTPLATSTATPAPTATATLEPTATPVPEADAVVVGDGVNLREGPGADYAVLDHLSRDEELDVHGSFGDCEWLQVTSRSRTLAGWVTGSAQYIELRVDCADIYPGIYRPMTGVISPNTSGGGSGELTVENGTDKDGLLVLTLEDDPVMSAYVRAEESFTLKGIRDGTYYLFFSTGAQWNGKQFMVEPSYRKFEDAFPFTTGATTYTIWSVTLHGVAGGTASAENVPADQFPGLGD